MIIFSIEDIINHSISYYLLILYLLFAIILNLLKPHSISFISTIIKLLPGLLLIFLSYINHGNPGIGDGILYLISSLYLDTSKIIFIFLMSIFTSGIYSILLIPYLKFSKKDFKNKKIAFIPTALPAIFYIFLRKGIL